MLAETAQSLIRCGLIAAFACGLAAMAGPMPARRTLVVIMLLPLVTPTLMTAYAYARWTLPPIHHPTTKDILYSWLILNKLTPLAVVVFWLLPPVMGAMAAHSLSLANPSWRLVAKTRLRRLSGRPVIAFAAVFFFAFHEFELASLLGMETWPVRLFDEHAGGLPWKDTLALATAPLVVQLGFVSMLVVLLRRLPQERLPDSFHHHTRFSRSVSRALAVVSAGTVTLLPLCYLAPQAISGMSAVVRSFPLAREVAASSCFALSGAVTALLASRYLGWKRGILFAVPGYFGPLAVALLTARLTTPLPFFYNSPGPLILAITLIVLPLAVLLQHLARRESSWAPAYLARSTRGWKPLWYSSGRVQFGIASLLFLCGWFELTASAILAPPGMTTTATRLHNLMHYGQSQGLTSMAVICFAVPFLTIVAAFYLARLSLVVLRR